MKLSHTYEPSRGSTTTATDSQAYFDDLTARAVAATEAKRTRRQAEDTHGLALEGVDFFNPETTIERLRFQYRLGTEGPVDLQTLKSYRDNLGKLRGFIAESRLAHLSAQKLTRMLEEETSLVGSAVETLSSSGISRGQKNRAYNYAGMTIARVLRMLGLPYVNREAVLFLWHNGGRALYASNEVDVIDPYQQVTVDAGRDPRDALETQARRRWNYPRSFGHAPSANGSLVALFAEQVIRRGM
jgi:hypothetical protein